MGDKYLSSCGRWSPSYDTRLVDVATRPLAAGRENVLIVDQVAAD